MQSKSEIITTITTTTHSKQTTKLENDNEIEFINETNRFTAKRYTTTLYNESRISKSVNENYASDTEATKRENKIKRNKNNRSFSRDSSCGRIFSKNRNTLRIYDEAPKTAMAPLHIMNQEEVKRKFLESKIPPVLEFRANKKVVQGIVFKHSKPNYKHFFKAKHILDTVKKKYGTDGNKYFEENFGKKVSSKQCINLIGKYLVDNKIGGEISINFAPGLTCSGRLQSYNWQKSKPEARKFVCWINDDDDNEFLREHGIICLSDHEIGTHYYRSYNEGLQTWFSDRKKFGLRSLSSNELLRTEEGLAALHTLMNARLKYLFLPAMLYYLACMAHRMNFEQLYDHMETYISSPEARWRHVTRVKRGISDPHEIGGYSRDQCYFEGAIEILEKIDEIDFKVLMSGKLCIDEIDRVKRLARVDCLKLPKFLLDMKSYKQKLRQIAIVNGIISASDINSEKADSVNDLENPKTINEIYIENDKKRKLNNGEVEKYIDEEIIRITDKKTKSPRVPKQKHNESVSSHSSSLCNIL